MKSPLSSLPWIVFHFQHKGLAHDWFWTPALTATYIFKMRLQSREYHLQGKPSAPQTECQSHITRATGGHLGRMPWHPVGPRRLRPKMAHCSIQHPVFVLENNRYHSPPSFLKDAATDSSACRLEQACTGGLHFTSARPSLHT